MLKMLRRRKDLYSSHFTAIILSTIAGLIMGPEFTAADSITFMVVYIALFLTFIATNSIDVCTQGASNSLFEHEGCVGISQGAELFGRFIGHAVVSVLLAVISPHLPPPTSPHVCPRLPTHRLISSPHLHLPHISSCARAYPPPRCCSPSSSVCPTTRCATCPARSAR